MSAPLVRREFRARPGRLLLVFLTVAAAVAFTSGAFGFSEQLSRLLNPVDAAQSVLSLPEGTVVITGRTDGLAAATALDDDLLTRVRGVDGVASAQGSYDQPVAFDVGWGQWDRPGLLRGVVMTSNYDPARWRVAEGRAPSGAGEVAVDRDGLAIADSALDAPTRLQLPIGTVDVRIVGIVEPTSQATLPVGPVDSAVDGTDGGDAPGESSNASMGGLGGRERDRGVGTIALASAHVVLDPSAAPGMLGAEGKVDRITVVPQPGIAPDALQDRLDDALPDGVETASITSPAAATQQTVSSIEDGVRLATYLYAGVTLLVSVLVVVNVLSVIVAQRTRELGLLRAIGAKRSALVRMVLVESVLIGLAAAAVGGAIGVVLAWAGAQAVEIGGIDVDFVLTPAMVGVAVAVGVVVTALGGLWPALRAGRVTPLDALSDTRAGADRTTRAPVPIVLTIGGFGFAAWASQRSNELTAGTAGLIGIGVVVGFVGLSLLSRWIVIPLAGALRGVVGRRSITARLGVGNARRQPSRTAGAASTLMVGLALVAVVSTVGASARKTIDEQVRDSGNADIYVERRGLVRVSTPALERFLALDPGIIDEYAEMIAIDGTVIGPDGALAQAVASDLPRAARVMNLGVTRGDPAEGRGSSDGDRIGGGGGVRGGVRGGVMVSERSAERLGVDVGSTVTLRSTSGAEVELPVVATYTNTAMFGGVIVDRTAAESVQADGTFELAGIDLRPGVDAGAVRWGFDFVTDQFNEMEAETPEEFARLRLTVADVALRVIGVMLVGALGVGFMGLAGTLALSTRERRNELVMLRAVGAKQRQVKLLVWIEATFIGVVAVLVGMSVGLGLGYAGTTVAPESLMGRSVIAWGQLALVAAVAVTVAWLVSLGVARRAARVPPSEAGRVE